MIKLSTIDIGDGIPSEFRIFKAGENPTTKGVFLFDELAAKLVMQEYQAHGVDIMIDLEHLSLADDSQNFNPDARGWAKLEIRDGELWATDVKWTQDGTARLSEKRQRYISPAFDVDESGRVTKILNLALTALPATDQAQALVAASSRGREALAAYPWDQCMSDQMSKGYDEETARKICGAIKQQNATEKTAMLSEQDAKIAADLVASVQAASEGAQDEKLKALLSAVLDQLSNVGKEEPAQVEDVAASEEPTAESVALSQARKTNEDLAKEVAQLRAERQAIELDRLILDNRDKLTPALEKWIKSVPVSTAREFLSAAPSVRTVELREVPAKAPELELTEDEKWAARKFGRSFEDALKFKAARLAARKDD